MTVAEPNAILAYWLVPTESARDVLASRIAELAERFDAPLFEPHVTVYGGRDEDDKTGEVLNRALAGFGPLRLSVGDIRCSEEFTKYELNPHLSLIYKEMTPEARADVAASITLPFTEVTFDCAKAIVCPRSIRSREDVENWRVVASQRLTK